MSKKIIDPANEIRNLSIKELEDKVFADFKFRVQISSKACNYDLTSNKKEMLKEIFDSDTNRFDDVARTRENLLPAGFNSEKLSISVIGSLVYVLRNHFHSKESEITWLARYRAETVLQPDFGTVEYTSEQILEILKKWYKNDKLKIVAKSDELNGQMNDLNANFKEQRKIISQIESEGV